jgi:hypothetical protein
MTEFEPLGYALLLVTGLLAGIINTLAGGGSNLTIPALMVLGMPADIANATNRVGILLQSLVGAKGFHSHGKLDLSDVGPVLVPNILGGLIGALLAAWIPPDSLKPILLATMIGCALLILLRPSVVAPPPGTVPFRVSERPMAWWGLFGAGIYGGFVHAGVGFVLIATLAGTLRYDLVRTNALKMVCTLGFTALALLIFIVDGLVRWVPGLVLGVATMAGAAIAVRIALKLSQNTLKWFLFLMTLCASAAAMWG